VVLAKFLPFAKIMTKPLMHLIGGNASPIWNAPAQAGAAGNYPALG
jgi:hypothetical protein